MARRCDLTVLIDTNRSLAISAGLEHRRQIAQDDEFPLGEMLGGQTGALGVVGGPAAWQ